MDNRLTGIGFFEQAAKEVGDLFGGLGKKAAKSLKGLGAEASLSVRGCLPPITW